MSTKNKKSVASQALLEMDAITSAIKEESKNTLNTLLAEAVRNALREGCEEEEDKEYDVVDDEQNDADDKEDDSTDTAKSDVDEDGNDEMENGMAPAEAPQNPQGMQSPMQGAEAQEAPIDGEGEEGWDEFSEYQTGDNTYDLTGENDYEKVVKVYKLLKDEDQVVVKQDGNTIHLEDEAAGTEYIIDLGTDGEEPEAEAVKGEDMPEPEMNLNESDIAGFDDDMDYKDDIDFEAQNDDYASDGEIADIQATLDLLQDKIDSLGNGDGEMNNVFENRKTRRPMKESKEVLFEVDLGYTDNYQDKDPIAGLSNNEPSKSGKSWHKGVPTGTKKPWAGETKSKGKPFEKTVNEEDEMPMDMDAPMDEQKNVGGFVQQNSVTRSEIPNSNGRKARNAHQGAKQVSNTSDNRSTMAEMKRLKDENKALKEAILAIRKNLNEAYVTNANLGKITKLFLENTTSQAEKIDIVNRFSNEAKTIEQSKTLYESIKRELNKTTTNTLNINESVSANGSKTLNENKVYKSADLLKTIDFMNRVLNC